jgi:hypothetical protein
MSANQLPIAFENAVLVAGELTAFLEDLEVEDYGAFWSPCECLKPFTLGPLIKFKGRLSKSYMGSRY